VISVGLLRIIAERTRLREFRKALENSGRLYYRTILNMMMKGLEKTEYLSRLAYNMKNVIERGVVYEASHLVTLIKKLQVENMSSQEKK